MAESGVRPGRNEACPCGSGRKYKHCCGGASVRVPPLRDGQIGVLVGLLERGQPHEAERAARTLLATYPNAGMLWKVLGVALMRQDKDALQALHHTAQLMPRDVEAHRNLGAALGARGLWARALECLQMALTLAPDDANCLVEAADALRALERTPESIPLYRRALANNPQLTEAHNNLGNAHLRLGQLPEAAACYRAALRLQPTSVEILCNLGNVERQLGSLTESLALSRKALGLDSASSVAHNTLGLTLAALGQRSEAVESFRRALTLQPRYVEALNNLGDVLRDLGMRRDALPLYLQAAVLDPGRVESHWNLGSALFELRRTQEAMASFAKALSLDPGHAPSHLSMGLALRQQRRPAEAEASCRAALAVNPDYLEALSLMGELLADRGRFTEAEALFERTLTIDPGYAHAYFSIATHRKMTLADAPWLAGATALLANPLPLGTEVSLRYALGKYFDDVARYDDAFENYRRANELTKRYGSTYDHDEFTRRVDGIIRRFDAETLRRLAKRGSPSERPVFIVGMPRSGTSLTEQILASHPAVFGAGELPFWDVAYAGFEKATEADGPAAHAGDDAESAAVARLAADYLERLAHIEGAGGRSRVIDKMPANFLYAGLIHAAFPKARIVHMQRHPIDTCLSIYFQNFFSMGPYANDLGNLAHYFREYRRVLDHWRSVLPVGVLMEVPYEALTRDQEPWSRAMLEFIGLPWDPKCLDFHETDRVVITASKWQVRQKMHAASAGRWRRYERHVGPLLGLLDPNE